MSDTDDKREMAEVDAQVFDFSTDFGGTSPTQTVKVPGVSKTGSRQQISKDSQQQTQQETTVNSWVEPRMSFSDMLDFYDMNVWHKRSVLLKAAVICGLGWDLTTDDNNKSEDADHARIMQLLDHPNNNPGENFSEICTRLIIDIGAVGNGFMETPRNIKGEIVELYHTRAATVRRDKNIKNGGYWQGINIGRPQIGKDKTHFATFGSSNRRPGQNEMLHYYQYDPKSDYYGIPDWFPSLADQLMDRNIAEYYINLFSNQLMARFAILVEGGKLSEKALKSVKNFIKNNHTGIQNAGGTLYLNSESKDVKIKIEKLNIDFGKDGDGKSNLRDQARDATIAAHGVPPRMVGVMQSGQLGGGGEVSGQLKSWKENDINPRQSRLEAFLNNTIIASFGDHKWKLKFNDMDVSDLKVDAEYWTKALSPQSGWANRNEAREDQGLPAEEDQENQQQQVEKFLDQLPDMYRQVSAFRKILETADSIPTDV